MKVNIGDSIGDCPVDGCGGSVVYDGDNNATCQICQAVYTVDFDDDEIDDEQVGEEIDSVVDIPDNVQSTPSQITIPELSNLPKKLSQQEPEVDQDQVKAEELQPDFDDAIGDLVAELPDDLDHLESLTEPKHVEGVVKQIDRGELNLPKHIKKSGPWKKAQHHSQNGNPFKTNSKSWFTFNLFNDGNTIEGAVGQFVKTWKGDYKFSLLLTIHEVVIVCVASGLLIMHPKTRIITVCKEIPVAVPLP